MNDGMAHHRVRTSAAGTVARTSTRRLVVCALLATSSLLALTSAAAAQNLWDGSESQDWFDPLNWSDGVPDVGAPGGLANIHIVGASPDPVVMNGGNSSTLNLVLGGASGDGRLDITGGARLSSFAGTLGDTAGSRGFVRVDDPLALWNLVRQLNVGFAGDGWLDIVGGGAVWADEITVGNLDSSAGEISVDGLSARLTAANGLVIGMDGRGGLQIRNGGVVTSAGGTIGAEATSSSYAHISGTASQWNNTGDLRIGIRGQGAMTILDGGRVTSEDGSIGYDAGYGEVKIANSGSWTNAGRLEVGGFGTGVLTLASDGFVSAGTSVTIAQQLGSVGVINIGSELGDPVAWAGYLSTPVLNFGAGTATLNFHHLDTALDFGAAMSGTGTINHYAGTTTLSANSSGFAGATSVSGGKLLVNGQLGGVVNVLTAGTLGGAGTLTTLNAGVGGTVAPGNSIGTLSATNVAFDVGSFYDVEVNGAGASDRILATGTATLGGGTVRVSASPDYVPNTRYTILTAAGGVNGGFAGTTTNLAFVTPVLSYDATNAFLTLVQGANFASAARTPNQLAVAGAADALGAGHAIHNALLPLTADQARQALDSLSGEGHASLSSILVEGSATVRQAALDRARAPVGSSSLALGYAGTPVLEAAPDSVGLWALAAGGRSSLAGDGNAALADGVSGGIVMGADGVAGDWRIGMMLHAGATGFSVADRGMTASSTDYGVGAYAGTAWGDTSLALGAAYTRHAISSTRTVAFGGFADTLTADYRAGTGQVFAELSHRFDLGRFELTPYGEVAYVAHARNGFTEAGGAAALTVGPGMQHAGFTTIGTRVSSTVLTGDRAPIRLEAGLGWRHAFGGAADTSSGLGGGSAYTTAGTPVAGDALVLDAAVSFDLSASAAVGLAYDGRVGAGGQAHALKATLGGAF